MYTGDGGRSRFLAERRFITLRWTAIVSNPAGWGSVFSKQLEAAGGQSRSPCGVAVCFYWLFVVVPLLPEAPCRHASKTSLATVAGKRFVGARQSDKREQALARLAYRTVLRPPETRWRRPEDAYLRACVYEPGTQRIT